MRWGPVIACALVAPARADIKPDPCACSPAKPGFFRRAQLTGDWNEHRKHLEDDGVILQAVYAGEVFAAAGLDKPVVVAGLFAVTFDLELDKLVSDKLGQVHISAFAIHGNGLTAELMDIYGTSGNVASEDARLFEAWLEQPIGPAAIRAGLLSADQEFNLARHSTALLNATFGITSQISYNLFGPVYPVATPGASARLELAHFSVRAALYDGTETNTHGIPTDLGPDELAIGELEVGKLVKLGAWHHTTRGNGGYVIVDHQLERYVGAFARAGISPDQAVSQYVDAGLRIGPGPFRDHDFIGLGIAFARNESGEHMGAQTVVEGTYQAQLGWLTVQPDFQLLMLRDRTAAIFATRATVVF